jgi:3-amino-5-hydroxybenzoic acid synthesis related protein
MGPVGGRRLRAVVFDFDGVLIDSEPLMRFAFESAFRALELPGEPPTEGYLEHMGDSFPRIVQRLGLPAELWAPYRELCRAHLGLVSLFPEAPALLARPRAAGLKLALVTGKDRVRTLESLEHFGLRPYFQAVVAADDLARPKPDPEGVQRALALVDCAPSEALMVGDAVNDVLCAQAAGVTAVAVTWGTKPERVQTLCRPDHVVHDWAALEELILARVPQRRPRPVLAPAEARA